MKRVEKDKLTTASNPGDPQDAHFGRVAKVQDENGDQATSPASPTWGLNTVERNKRGKVTSH